ncbi:uncharacterized protein LOC111884831 [Lactuca sativa]|uniref:Uncharacterized protein n=1 Tax=Lactuca sativa TaxID=4236 RepID=A0A9R1WAI8_LACSA|nr:uncharacterized protein LOC111884831 [Lactuca sativa]KAJ0219357.1 hypothetical protein LSAT_V11C300140570 [Lactuca sativa]
MEQQGDIEGSGSSPSFSFYASDTSTSMAIAKVIREEARFNEFGDSDEDDFRFSLDLSEEEVSAKEIDSRGWIVFPLFNRDLVVKDEVKSKDNEIHASDSITSSLRKLFIDEPEESSSCSSSEADELEALPSGTYCVWRPKTEGGSSAVMTKIKKSSSTGSLLKKWKLRYMLRRSNSEGKDPVILLTPKKKGIPVRFPKSPVSRRLKLLFMSYFTCEKEQKMKSERGNHFYLIGKWVCSQMSMEWGRCFRSRIAKSNFV